MSKQRLRLKIAFFAVILILVLVMIYSGLRILESTVFYKDQQPEAFVSRNIERDGVTYYPRKDITVIMVLGIGEEGPVVSSESHRNENECDAVMLLILDQTDETYRILTLNRDTMVDMPWVGEDNKVGGTIHQQLALAHTYGSGLEDSCEYTRDALSWLLYDLEIDHYVSVKMDAISLINDAVGGVTVEVKDDFSQVDDSLPMGEVTLTGDQAWTFVQSRRAVGDQLNISRMERHKEYMDGLMEAMTQKASESDTFLYKLYEQVADYIVTDCSVNVITGLMERCADYTLKEIVSPEGENVLNEYYEFHLDEEKLDELILRLFYAPK